MNPTSQTTARVVQAEMQPPLPTPLEEVSAQCSGFKVRLRAWLSSYLNQHFPYGYEDESGFHYGVDQRDQRSD